MALKEIPRFIAFTGIDGSGKSTQAQMLSSSLLLEGLVFRYVWVRWEPKFLKPASQVVRALTRLKTRRSIDTEAVGHRAAQGAKNKLFQIPGMKTAWLALASADYFLQVRRKICIPLQKGVSVVSDRYIFDFIADLSVNFGCTDNEIYQLCRHPFLRSFPLPSLSFHIEIPAQTGYERKADGTPLPYLEERVRVYRALARHYGMVVLDGTKPPVDLAQEVMRYLKEQPNG